LLDSLISRLAKRLCQTKQIHRENQPESVTCIGRVNHMLCLRQLAVVSRLHL
jgi:hypothetical protein